MVSEKMTEQQIAALRYLIFHARNVNVKDVSKRIMACLIQHSEGLTKEVCLTIVENRDGFSTQDVRDASDGVDFMLSSNGTMHLSQILRAMGSTFTVSQHYGDFDATRQGDAFNSDGIFAGMPEHSVSRPGLVSKGLPLRYTFWLAREYYSRNAISVSVTKTDLDAIDLKKSGLYPSLESAS